MGSGVLKGHDDSIRRPASPMGLFPTVDGFDPDSAMDRPDRISASRRATVPGYYRGMWGRLSTLPGAIDGSSLALSPRARFNVGHRLRSGIARPGQGVLNPIP